MAEKKSVGELIKIVDIEEGGWCKKCQQTAKLEGEVEAAGGGRKKK